MPLRKDVLLTGFKGQEEISRRLGLISRRLD
jgi:hypothetical protein